MCLLVTRAPMSSLAPASLHELDRLCELFEQVGGKSITAANNLVRSGYFTYFHVVNTSVQEVVQKLRRQAHEASSKTESVDRTNPASAELDRIGGKTHLISPNPNTASSLLPSPASSPESVRRRFTSFVSCTAELTSALLKPMNGELS